MAGGRATPDHDDSSATTVVGFFFFGTGDIWEVWKEAFFPSESRLEGREMMAQSVSLSLILSLTFLDAQDAFP